MTRSRNLLTATVLIWGLCQAAPGLCSPDSAAMPDRSLPGDAVCTRCHDESEQKPILAIYKTRHGVKADTRTPGCQSCHGASDAHVKNPAGTSQRPSPDVVFGARTATDIQTQSAVCSGCHDSSNLMHWTGSQHQTRNVGCTSCHEIHTLSDKVLTKRTQPEVCFACHTTQRAETRLISTHPLAAGKMACSDCHNPHGSMGPKLLAENSVNETCQNCHAEKRGPFLWEHGPVTDDCTNCHTPHGSPNTPLLKARPPWLCQECHSTDHASFVYSGSDLPSATNTSPAPQVVLRACLNCHSQIHGSNDPAGAKFNR